MSYQADRYKAKKKSKKVTYLHGCSDKARYRSKEKATEHLIAIRYHAELDDQNGRRQHKIPVRAYQCENCNGGWHLTSQEDRFSTKFNLAA